jgi:hypothetical protein
MIVKRSFWFSSSKNTIAAGLYDLLTMRGVVSKASS